MPEHAHPDDVEAFRLKARAWLADTMPRLPEGVENAQLMF